MGEQYDKVISFESLYKAHKRARLGKRWKNEVIDFELNLVENLWALHYDLKYHRYQMSGYHRFMIYDPKEREIQAISYKDRIVQHTLCDNYLTPLLEKHLIYDNGACRKGKGTSFAIQRLRHFMTEYYRKNGLKGFFVKIDVHKYFPSINHEILKGKLCKVIDDDNLWSLITTIIDSFNPDINKGLPMGNQSSQNFALYYLDSVDRLIKEKMKVKYYLRYMDDMVLIVKTKEEAIKCLETVKQELEQVKLEINPKSEYMPLSQGIAFLGWHFFYSKKGKIIQRIKQQSKKRISKKVKTNRGLLQDKRITQEEYQQRKASYIGHLKGGNTWHYLTYLFGHLSKEKRMVK